jgi:hypothetical protein
LLLFVLVCITKSAFPSDSHHCSHARNIRLMIPDFYDLLVVVVTYQIPISWASPTLQSTTAYINCLYLLIKIIYFKCKNNNTCCRYISRPQLCSSSARYFSHICPIEVYPWCVLINSINFTSDILNTAYMTSCTLCGTSLGNTMWYVSALTDVGF